MEKHAALVRMVGSKMTKLPCVIRPPALSFDELLLKKYPKLKDGTEFRQKRTQGDESYSITCIVLNQTHRSLAHSNIRNVLNE